MACEHGIVEGYCPACDDAGFINAAKTAPVVVDTLVEAVRADLLERSRSGLLKYGVGVDRTDLSLRDWLQHAYEETLDQANYLKRAILEIDAKAELADAYSTAS